jgi:uncharacterized membrane protein YidH (DUF202 family)
MIWYILTIYILNTLLNRWLYFKLCEMNEDYYPNSPAALTIFLSVFGTIVFLVFIGEELLVNVTISNWIKRIYTPKNRLNE